jgi:hypothetical protein
MATPKKKGKDIRRQDRAGHLDPAHAKSLRAKGEENHTHDADRAFVEGRKTPDTLAEELAEEAVRAMTSGEDSLAEGLDAPVPEEEGGPFVRSSGGEEFASGTDPSNPKGAKPEPIPRT